MISCRDSTANRRRVAGIVCTCTGPGSPQPAPYPLLGRGGRPGDASASLLGPPARSGLRPAVVVVRPCARPLNGPEWALAPTDADWPHPPAPPTLPPAGAVSADLNEIDSRGRRINRCTHCRQVCAAARVAGAWPTAAARQLSSWPATSKETGSACPPPRLPLACTRRLLLATPALSSSPILPLLLDPCS